MEQTNPHDRKQMAELMRNAVNTLGIDNDDDAAKFQEEADAAGLAATLTALSLAAGNDTDDCDNMEYDIHQLFVTAYGLQNAAKFMASYLKKYLAERTCPTCHNIKT